MVREPDFIWLDDHAIVSSTVSFVRHLDPVEALRRVGADLGSLPALAAAAAEGSTRGTGRSPIRAADRGEWIVLIEYNADTGVNERTLPALSADTQGGGRSAATGMDLFYYDEFGRTTTIVETTLPENRYGE